MKSKHERCRHCGRKGKITFYYLGLNEKVKKWCKNEESCKKNLVHWKEKKHWLTRERPQHDTRKEIWNGERFRELAWFWDLNVTWLLPATCPSNTKCKGVVSADIIDLSG